MNMKLMNRKNPGCPPLLLTVFTLLAFSTAIEAQVFTYTDGDLCLGFRKVSPYTENNEVVVNIGQASTYVNAAIGTTLPVSGFSSSQLVSGSFATLSNLTWSVFGWFSIANTNYPGYPTYTLWVTAPRTNNAVRSSDPSRKSFGDQADINGEMSSIFDNAVYVSSDIGVSGTYNTATFVRESIATYGMHLYSVWMISLVNSKIGTLNDTWVDNNDNNLEVTTPGNFSSGSVRSDLYEVRPLVNGHGGTVVDPHTGTSGLAYYVGYFEFKSDGTMTFTREGSSSPPVAGFTGTPTTGFAPLQVVFTNTSTGSFTNSLWNFGDGHSITNNAASNVTNTYAAGSYTVTLTATGPGGTNTSARTNYIVASPSVTTIGNVTVLGGQLVFGGTNCPAGVQYRILTSTNAALPLSSWQPVVTNMFLGNGSYFYTNSTGGKSAAFFRLVSP